MRKSPKKKLNQQRKNAAIRAKYGPRGRPAPVTLKRLNEFGEWEVAEPCDQEALPRKKGRRKYAALLERLAVEAGFASYDAFLRSPEWRSQRRQRLLRDGWRCTRCGSKDHLQVHHRHYPSDLLAVNVDRVLLTLCRTCHKAMHAHHSKAA